MMSGGPDSGPGLLKAAILSCEMCCQGGAWRALRERLAREAFVNVICRLLTVCGSLI